MKFGWKKLTALITALALVVTAVVVNRSIHTNAADAVSVSVDQDTGDITFDYDGISEFSAYDHAVITQAGNTITSTDGSDCVTISVDSGSGGYSVADGEITAKFYDGSDNQLGDDVTVEVVQIVFETPTGNDAVDSSADFEKDAFTEGVKGGYFDASAVPNSFEYGDFTIGNNNGSDVTSYNAVDVSINGNLVETISSDGTYTYTYDPADVDDGVVTISAVFVHDDKGVIDGTVKPTITVNSANGNFTVDTDDLKDTDAANLSGGTFNYAWIVDGSLVINDSATYTTAVVGKTVTVVVTNNNYHGSVATDEITVYKVVAGTPSGNTGTDAFGLTDFYGVASDLRAVPYSYTLGSVNSSSAATSRNILSLKDLMDVAIGEDITTAGTSAPSDTLSLTSVNADSDGVITVTPTFTHDNKTTFVGTVSLSVNASTGVITAAVNKTSGGENSSYTYQWKNGDAVVSGETDATLAAAKYTPGEVVGVTVTETGNLGTAKPANTITVYKVVYDVAGTATGDTPDTDDAVDVYGILGASANFTYAVDDGDGATERNHVTITKGSGEPVEYTSNGTYNYTIVSADATAGVISFDVVFTHDNKNSIGGTVSLSINSTNGNVTAGFSGANADLKGDALTAPFEYEYSTDGSTWYNYSTDVANTSDALVGETVYVRVSHPNALGYATANVTVYKVMGSSEPLDGAYGTDSVAVNPDPTYGKVGETAVIEYTIGDHEDASTETEYNYLKLLTGPTNYWLDGTQSSYAYEIKASDATDGKIMVSGSFIHSDDPPLRGNPTYVLNTTTGEITVDTSSIEGNNDELQYSLDGGTDNVQIDDDEFTLSTSDYSLGTPFTITITDSDSGDPAFGSIELTITIYRIAVKKANAAGSDNVAADLLQGNYVAGSSVYSYTDGTTGTPVSIAYTLTEGGTATNTLTFSGTASTLSGVSPVSYTFNSADATDGVVTITGTFAHTNTATTYTLTVVNGIIGVTGSVTTESELAAGVEKTITATTAPEGKHFAGWTVTPGTYENALGDADAASTTVTMPAANITVTANYENDPDENVFPGAITVYAWLDGDYLTEGTLNEDGTFSIIADGVTYGKVALTNGYHDEDNWEIIPVVTGVNALYEYWYPTASGAELTTAYGFMFDNDGDVEGEIHVWFVTKADNPTPKLTCQVTAGQGEFYYWVSHYGADVFNKVNDDTDAWTPRVAGTKYTGPITLKPGDRILVRGVGINGYSLNAYEPVDPWYWNNGVGFGASDDASEIGDILVKASFVGNPVLLSVYTTGRGTGDVYAGGVKGGTGKTGWLFDNGSAMGDHLDGDWIAGKPLTWGITNTWNVGLTAVPKTDSEFVKWTLAPGAALVEGFSLTDAFIVLRFTAAGTASATAEFKVKTTDQVDPVGPGPDPGTTVNPPPYVSTPVTPITTPPATGGTDTDETGDNGGQTGGDISVGNGGNDNDGGDNDGGGYDGGNDNDGGGYSGSDDNYGGSATGGTTGSGLAADGSSNYTVYDPANPPTLGDVPTPAYVLANGRVVENEGKVFIVIEEEGGLVFIFDEDGTPLGYIILKPGQTLDDIDIMASLLPLAAAKPNPKTGSSSPVIPFSAIIVIMGAAAAFGIKKKVLNK